MKLTHLNWSINISSQNKIGKIANQREVVVCMCIRGKDHRSRIYFRLISKIKNFMNSKPFLIRRELDIERYDMTVLYEDSERV